MDRRTFSKSIVSGLTLTATGMSLNTLAAVLGVENSVSECLSCEEFKQLVGHQYGVSGEAGGQLELSGINAASKTNPDQQFYLVFKQSQGLKLDEGIYELLSPNGKPLTLRLSPSSTRPDMMEAVINLQNAA